MELIPNRTFLVRQDEQEDGKKKDVVAHRGQRFNFSDREAIKFWGAIHWEKSEKLHKGKDVQKRLLRVAKDQRLQRTV